MQYTSPTEVRREFVTSLSTAASSDVDPALAKVITFVSRGIDRFCNRRFYTTTGDEVVDLDGPRLRSRILRPAFDIASLTSLQLAEDSVRASSGTYTTLSTGDVYLQPADRPEGWPALWLQLPETESGTYNSSAPFMHFQPGERTVRFTGKRGWNTVDPSSSGFPQEIRLVAIELSVKLWRMRDAGFSNVLGISDVGTAIVERAMSPWTREVLEGYRKVTVS